MCDEQDGFDFLSNGFDLSTTSLENESDERNEDETMVREEKTRRARMDKRGLLMVCLWSN